MYTTIVTQRKAKSINIHSYKTCSIATQQQIVTLYQTLWDYHTDGSKSGIGSLDSAKLS